MSCLALIPPYQFKSTGSFIPWAKASGSGDGFPRDRNGRRGSGHKSRGLSANGLSTSLINLSGSHFPGPRAMERPEDWTFCQPIHKLMATRRSGNFQKSIWDYDYIMSLSSEYKDESYMEESRMLKEEVRMMLCKMVNYLDQLEMIGVLQRLGVAYHFNDEISNILDNIYNMETFKKRRDLYATSLEFRLLRQYGYDIYSDVFNCFLDEKGNFKEDQPINVEGILSLYEASFYSVEDEIILDHASDFTLKFLKDYVNNNSDDNYISLLINHALEVPLHRRAPRWEASWFINAYERSHTVNPTLLQFAKLDFNMLQSTYQEELTCALRWWKGTHFAEKLSFSRDRIVETYFWNVGIYFHPDCRYFRIALTKVNCFITAIDDIYDLYGTLEELKLFTEVIDRWDLSYGMDILPDYMKICFLALHNFVNDMAYEILKDHGFYIAPYLQKSWATLCKAYLVEAKWYHSGYLPSFEEYMENGFVSIAVNVIYVHSFFTLPDTFKKEKLDYIAGFPNVSRFSSMMCRLCNDLGTFKREKDTGDVVKALECYMKNTGASEVEAREHINSIICTMWKKMNKEGLNFPFSQSYKEVIFGLPRMGSYIYQRTDGHTYQDPETMSRIKALLIEPIPFEC